MIRCGWCETDPVYMEYHDKEWGVPIHEDRKLFEFLVLEGAQAGLSWLTILKRREGYRLAFADFDPKKVARFSPKKAKQLQQDKGIIRNKRKIESAIKNAQAFLNVVDEFGSFDHYIWRFVEGRPLQNRFHTLKDIPAETALSQTISKDLQNRGFSFVGPVIVYAHMQATGMVNDHVVSCFRYKEVCRLSNT